MVNGQEMPTAEYGAYQRLGRDGQGQGSESSPRNGEVRGQVRGEVRNVVRSQVKHEVRGQVKHEVRGQVRLRS